MLMFYTSIYKVVGLCPWSDSQSAKTHLIGLSWSLYKKSTYNVTWPCIQFNWLKKTQNIIASDMSHPANRKSKEFTLNGLEVLLQFQMGSNIIINIDSVTHHRIKTRIRAITSASADTQRAVSTAIKVVHNSNSCHLCYVTCIGLLSDISGTSPLLCARCEMN